MGAKRNLYLLFIISFLFAYLLTGCASAPSKKITKLKEEPQEEIPPEIRKLPPIEEEEAEYIIAKQDQLLITVWANDDLDTETIVRPDGKISFPLIGDVQAAGLTIPQLDEAITEGLKKYIRKPEVSVVIKELYGKRVSILGEISSPGIYRLENQDRVLELAALAGGFTSNGVLSRVIIVRRKPEPSIILLDLNKAILQADPTQNIVLQPDDVVYVSKKLVANIKYFWDQVFGPAVDQAIKIEDKTHTWGRGAK